MVWLQFWRQETSLTLSEAPMPQGCVCVCTHAHVWVCMLQGVYGVRDVKQGM